ncbi:hypothetical protein HMPREF9466_02378 [Fusobacterium necrophorum subsp. funduliforme 1_1_36S]|nr:hypothetical protein HMPREF9466_02378 [Fusobacterium necrophorum subsp. funduliforme 1_1_36S]
MNRIVLELGMFETLSLAVLAIYFGEFLRKQFPVLKNIVYLPLLWGEQYLLLFLWDCIMRISMS